MQSTESPATIAGQVSGESLQERQLPASPRLRFGVLGLLFSALAISASAVALLTHVRPFSGIGLAVMVGCMPTGLLLSAFGAVKDPSRKAAVAGLMVTALHVVVLGFWVWRVLHGR